MDNIIKYLSDKLKNDANAKNLLQKSIYDISQKSTEVNSSFD